MMDFSGISKLFNILIAIFIGVAILYFACIFIVKVIKKKRINVLVSILCGIFVIPLITTIISFIFLQIGVAYGQVKNAAGKSSMRNEAINYLYTKYGFEKDDYIEISVDSHAIFFLKDEQNFQVDNYNNELKDNYQSKKIKDALGEYINGVLGYSVEINSGFEFASYGIDRRFDGDTSSLIHSVNNLGFLSICIYGNDDSVEMMMKKVDENQHLLNEILQTPSYFYICTSTPTQRTVSSVRLETSELSDGKYVAYSKRGYYGWVKEPDANGDKKEID